MEVGQNRELINKRALVRRLRLGLVRPREATVQRYGIEDLVAELGCVCRQKKPHDQAALRYKHYVRLLREGRIQRPRADTIRRYGLEDLVRELGLTCQGRSSQGAQPGASTKATGCVKLDAWAAGSGGAIGGA